MVLVKEQGGSSTELTINHGSRDQRTREKQHDPTPGAKAACIDIKDFNLNKPLPSPEFVRFQADTIPDEIWEQYGLDNYVVDS